MIPLDSSKLAVSGTPPTLEIIAIASHNRNVALLHMRCKAESSAELACTSGAFATGQVFRRAIGVCRDACFFMNLGLGIVEQRWPHPQVSQSLLEKTLWSSGWRAREIR